MNNQEEGVTSGSIARNVRSASAYTLVLLSGSSARDRMVAVPHEEVSSFGY
jgi:hypothetical protein